MRGWEFVLPLVVLATVLPGVEGAPVLARIEFDAPAYAEGAMTFVASTPGFVAAYGTTNDATAQLSVLIASGHATMTDVTQRFLVVDGHSGPIPETEENETRPLATGPFRIDLLSVDQNLTVAFLPTHGFVASMNKSVIGRPVESPSLSSPFFPDGDTFEPFERSAAGDWPNRYGVRIFGTMNHVHANNFTVSYSGDFSLLLSGATVRVTSAAAHDVVQTGSWRESSLLWGAETGETYVAHHVSLLIQGTGAIEAAYAGPFGHLGGSRFELHNVSALAAPLVQATISEPAGSRQFEHESFLDVNGQFSLTLESPTRDGRLIATMTGDVQEIRENRKIIHAITDADATVAAATTATLLAMILGWSAWKGRAAILFWLARNETTPLGNPVRQALLDRIREQPGITQADLSRLVSDRSERYARYHLRVLERAALIVAVKHGKSFAYLPNSPAFRDVALIVEGQPETVPGDRISLGPALAALSHPHRRRIYQTLRQTGPATCEDLLESLASSQLEEAMTPRAIAYHAARLEQVGLLKKGRDGRCIRWAVVVDLDRRGGG